MELETYEPASIKEVDEFFNGDVLELGCLDDGTGIGRTEMTFWTDGTRVLRRVVSYGCFDWSEVYHWVYSSRL